MGGRIRPRRKLWGSRRYRIEEDGGGGGGGVGNNYNRGKGLGMGQTGIPHKIKIKIEKVTRDRYTEIEVYRK